MELLIRVVDKEGADVTNACKGDVIAIQPDGWEWSKLERTEPFWRIIRVPLIKAEADALLSRATTEQMKINTGNRFREYKIDFELLPTPIELKGLRDKDIITLTKEEAITAIVKK